MGSNGKGLTPSQVAATHALYPNAGMNYNLTPGGKCCIIGLVKTPSQRSGIMREVQSSEVKARLPQFLDEVEQGETIVITRHGRPVAHLVPAPDCDRERVGRALDGIAALRQTTSRVSLDELLASRHEGHKY